MKKHWNFIIRAVNLLLILAVLWQYQQVALVRPTPSPRGRRRSTR